MQDRDYKIFRCGEFYHVYNRGNNRQDIYSDLSDYLEFIKRCKLVLGIIHDHHSSIKSLPDGAFDIVCYCLMPNYFHLVIRQNTDIPIDRFITKACTSYALYFNKKYKRVGNVFQDAFKAKLVVDDTYLTYLSAYAHNNPKDPCSYEFSSFPDIIGDRNGKLCKRQILLGFFNSSAESYKKFVLGYEKYSKNIRHLLFDEDEE